jgi:arylsulfatase A-like enzyme
MLSILSGHSPRFCDGMSRRGFLQVGAAGVGGVALADFLRADAAAASPSYARKSFINIYLPGGPTHMDTFDPKPEAPSEFRGEFRAIATNVTSVMICEHLPKLAAMMDKLAIIRSLAGFVDEHDSCQTETGWNTRSLTNMGGRPSLGTVVSKVHGASSGSVPTFVDLSGYTKTGFVGPVNGAFRPDGPGRENLRLERSITVSRLDDRQKLLGGLDRFRSEADTKGAMKAMDAFAGRAYDVITSGVVAKALDLSQEDPRVRARYFLGDNNNGMFQQNDRFLMARRLVSAGVRCVSLGWGGWDTHGNNFGHLRQQLPPLDQGLSSLIEDLEAHGLLDDTVVAVWGEFGRTPRVNSGAGRDHWPRACSVLLAGGGLQTGQVIGATNRLGEEPKDRPVHLHELFATLYLHMGIDPRYTTLTDNNGRPQYLIEKPDPVRELIG